MEPPAKRELLGKVAIAVTGCSAVGILAVAAPFLSPALRKICLPYVPATDTQVRNVVSLLQRRPRCSAVVDLGSGDGRIVLAAARLGFARCVGVELNPWLVAYSRMRALRTTGARFVRADLWHLDLTPFDNVVVFGVQQMMAPLERKLVHQLKPGSWVLACRFPLPTLPPDETYGTGVDTVWLYSVKSAAAHLVDRS
ncbi:hypothetical protein HPB51_009738 [Rhipicephalus microplus]|uniref:Methyltransferase domain-containing protein n=1 Tax=Rhipicephalus microplus TaxID=6941 RepID=A0A9J6F073_RHIMP|nr:ATP synthase subunit C lysine N-methyltransferase-like [Rhipicephalus microplus]KAH8040190.1 hypothetical protein HPB51_009738 [Rhipicephalus microplus]